jgi:hypothetical protein
MANIVTSYHEIYRLDGQHISKKDRGRLCGGLIKEHEKFGSYWVRIFVEYDDKLRCLRIQFGGSKRYRANDILEGHWFVSQFFLLKREADECGNRDGFYIESIPEILKNVFHNFDMNSYSWDEAQYSFDRVLLGGAARNFHNIVSYKNEVGTRHLINVGGMYQALSDRSYIDAIPGVGYGTYEPSYQPTRFVFDNYGPQHVQWYSLAQALPKEMKDFFSLEPELDFVALCWQGRAVHILDRRGYTNFAKDPKYWHERDALPAGLCAAGWDNLVNPSYLAFRAWHAEQVRLTDQTL